MSGRPMSRMTTSIPVVASAMSRPSSAGRRGLDDVAVLLEQPPQQADEPRVVLDDEQMHGGQPTASITG